MPLQKQVPFVALQKEIDAMGLLLEAHTKFTDREAIRQVPTPVATASWKPIPHIEVIETVSQMVANRDWQIIDEEYGLARDGQKLFGVIRINRTNSLDWHRCIGLRNSHDRSMAVGLTAGICVVVCTNMAFGGSMVLKRRHTSRIELQELVQPALDRLEDEFLTLETVAEELKIEEVYDDEVRSVLVRAAEAQAIPSCDILSVWDAFKQPQHEEFADPTRWSLLNAFTETAKKYSPARADVCYRNLTRLFGLDGKPPTLWR